MIVFLVLLNHTFLKNWQEKNLYMETLDWLQRTKPDPWSEN